MADRTDRIAFSIITLLFAAIVGAIYVGIRADARNTKFCHDRLNQLHTSSDSMVFLLGVGGWCPRYIRETP